LFLWGIVGERDDTGCKTAASSLIVSSLLSSSRSEPGELGLGEAIGGGLNAEGTLAEILLLSAVTCSLGLEVGGVRAFAMEFDISDSSTEARF